MSTYSELEESLTGGCKTELALEGSLWWHKPHRLLNLGPSRYPSSHAILTGENRCLWESDPPAQISARGEGANESSEHARILSSPVPALGSLEQKEKSQKPLSDWGSEIGDPNNRKGSRQGNELLLWRLSGGGGH